MTGDRVMAISSVSSTPSLAPIRNPIVGTRRKLVLSFKDNSLIKVGVQFDKPIVYGVNLVFLIVLMDSSTMLAN